MREDDLLFHSFPRGAEGAERDRRALQILGSILGHGLLITPETTVWKAAPDRKPIHVAQKRICFTALRQSELGDHAKLFGDMSLGFFRRELESLGATPVFYVSRTLQERSAAHNVGSFYIDRVLQMQVAFGQLARAKIDFEVDGMKIKTAELESFVRYLSGLFYPIEDLEEGRNRVYFAQREWRILGNLWFGRRQLSVPLTDEQAAALMAIDERFFGKMIAYATGESRTVASGCMLIPESNGRPIREAIKVVVAPPRLRSAVEKVLADHDVAPELVVAP